MVGLEGNLKIIKSWNHSMLGLEEVLKVTELQNCRMVGLEGTSKPPSRSPCSGLKKDRKKN